MITYICTYQLQRRICIQGCSTAKRRTPDNHSSVIGMKELRRIQGFINNNITDLSGKSCNRLNTSFRIRSMS